MRRLLPLRPAPVHRETLGSYLARLAEANRLKPFTLPTVLGISPLRRDADPALPWPPDAVNTLAQLVGRAPAMLLHTFPALNEGLQPRAIHHIRPACSACANARGITSLVTLRLAEHELVCRRHRRWLADTRQHRLDDLPEILEANRAHRGLARRHPPTVLDGAFREAAAETRSWFSADARPEHAQRWAHRLDALEHDPFATSRRPSPERVALVLYPEAVDLAAAYVAAASRTA